MILYEEANLALGAYNMTFTSPTTGPTSTTSTFRQWTWKRFNLPSDHNSIRLIRRQPLLVLSATPMTEKNVKQVPLVSDKQVAIVPIWLTHLQLNLHYR